MDLLRYAENILKEKNLEITEESLKIVINNLKKRINKRYHAVGIGIDGTLENMEETDDGILEVIYKLLNKHIPIVLITGRGESGLKKFFASISNRLIREKGLNKELIKNIIAVTNDGEILFYTSKMENNGKDNQTSIKLLDKSKLLVEEKDLDEVKKIREHIASFFDNGMLNVYFKDSKCESLSKDLVSFRMVVEDEKYLEKVQQFIEYFINSEKTRNPNSKVVYTTGKFKHKSIFQISVGSKGEALKIVERFLGIPENSMLRIGDQGNRLGSDFSMLDCEQGYSVDVCSQSIDNCYPICDEDGNILKGIEATKYILSHEKILPTVCLKKPDKERYTRQLALSEKSINLGKKEIINKYNNIINEVFDISEGFENVFDKKSGAITFDDWQWELIDDNNELKQLFSHKINGGYRYILNTDTSKLLRGSDTYYYFLANKVEKVPDTRLIMAWFMNYMEFFKEARSIMQNYRIKDIQNDLKLILGLLDNMRNVALINLNASIISEYPESKSILLSLDTYMKDDGIKEWFNICNNIYEQMESICFNKKRRDNYPHEIYAVLDKIIEKYPKIVSRIIAKNDPELNKRCFRTYREIDNFIENFITMNLTIEKLKAENAKFLDREINFSGMIYGGIELPLLARSILAKHQCDVDTSAILIKKNGYNQLHSDVFFDDLIRQDMKIVSSRDYSQGFNVVSDDNVLTGVTLQAAMELLFSKDIYINNLAVVRYPSINRIEHMFAKDRGAIDTSKFTTYIKGLIFPSPYSKIKPRRELFRRIGNI